MKMPYQLDIYSKVKVVEETDRINTKDDIILFSTVLWLDGQGIFTVDGYNFDLGNMKVRIFSRNDEDHHKVQHCIDIGNSSRLTGKDMRISINGKDARSYLLGPRNLAKRDVKKWFRKKKKELKKKYHLEKTSLKSLGKWDFQTEEIHRDKFFKDLEELLNSVVGKFRALVRQYSLEEKLGVKNTFHINVNRDKITCE